MFEKIPECPICHGKSFKNRLICQDHLVTGESFVLTDCETCGLRLTNPRPIISEIGKYYESENYNPHSGKASNLFSLIYKMARSLNLSWKKTLVNQCATRGGLLDYGAGTGEFALKMKADNWDVHAVEPNQKARDFALKEYDLYLQANYSELPDNQVFNVISLWHVLEHLHEPIEEMKQLISLLHKEGRILIAVPNYLSYDAQKYQEAWAGYDVPRHLSHFNPSTMNKFLKSLGLNILQTVPMKMDAYYVSILSENNLGHSWGFMKGMITGFRSNAWAKSHHNNYSSLVYIAKK